MSKSSSVNLIVKGLICDGCSRAAFYLTKPEFSRNLLVSSKLFYVHRDNKEPKPQQEIKCQWCEKKIKTRMLTLSNVANFYYQDGQRAFKESLQ